MQGIGVMLRELRGNAETVSAYHSAVGRTIQAVELTQDDVLKLTFTDGAVLCATDNGQSCCETRYMRTDDDLTEFTGAKLLGLEIKEAPSVEVGGDCGNEHDVQFLEVQTSRGVFTMASHNEHNGYYGGFSIELSFTGPPAIARIDGEGSSSLD